MNDDDTTPLGGDGEEPPKRGLSRPVAVVRDELMNDPNTHELAKTLGVEVEEYIDLVIEYAQNPEKEPELYVIEEEDALEEGIEIPTYKEVGDWLKAIESGEVEFGPKKLHEQSTFSTEHEEVKLKAAAGIDSVEHTTIKPGKDKGDIVVEDNEMGSILRQQLLNQQRKSALTTNPARKKKQRRTRKRDTR